MKCRRLKKENNINNVVWFGSYGKNTDGTAKFYKDDNKHDNYSTSSEGVADSLTQRLNVIQGELWYNVKKGIPLFEKQKKKGVIDSYVITTITDQEDVISITSFNSKIIDNHIYEAEIIVNTKYGEIEINI